jgi:hypothetical protein
VVGARDRRGDLAVAGAVGVGELVESHRQALGGAAVVDEDDRRAVRADQLEQLRVDRRPDPARGRGGAVAGGRIDHLRLRGGLAHVLDRHVDAQVERLAHAGVDDRAGPPAGQEAADLVERPLRRRQADPLQLPACGAVEPLECQREMGAALGLGDRVDLVDDDPLRPGEDLARARGQHQVERLGGGDEDVGRAAQHRLAIALGGVAGPDPDLDLTADPLQRRAQVALDVVGESLQGRDVDQPRAALVGGLGDEPVEPPEERRERLARPGRGRDQRVAAGGDRGPRLGLGRGRLGEGAREPITDLGGERRERVGGHRTPQRTSHAGAAGPAPAAGGPGPDALPRALRARLVSHPS